MVEIDQLDKKIKDFDSKYSSTKKNIPSSQKYGIFLSIGIEFAASILVGTFLGMVLDKYLNIKPIGLIICITIGCAAAYKNIMNNIK